MCLVSAKSEYRYLALSYVWGTGKSFKTLKSNIDRLKQDGALELSETPSDENTITLPQTIRDVIHLTRLLGEQFLWIDALCILQDDDDDRSVHLNCMGSIYANAYITLVAAGGSAFEGLRGIENATPAMDRPNEIANLMLDKESLHLKIERCHHKLEKSIYNSRAWTFQEIIFSRRLLILFNTEVNWICHCAVWFEGLEVIENQCANNREVVAQGFDFGTEPDLWEYAVHVQEYNRRQLTYPEDALDAMLGILNILKTVFGNFLCGLPIVFFDAALLWYNKAPLERRQPRRGPDNLMPPSWTWAAWAGGISYRDHAKTPNSIKPIVGWMYKANDQTEWQPVFSFQNRQATDTQSDQHKLIVPVVENTSRNTSKNNEDINIRLSRGPQMAQLLFARAERSFFRHMEIYGDLQALLTSKTGRSVGMLTACEAMDSKTKSRDFLFEVIAISEISQNGNEIKNVLWISWQDSIAYRRGVGWISKSGWAEQTSERIDVFLG